MLRRAVDLSFPVVIADSRFLVRWILGCLRTDGRCIIVLGCFGINGFIMVIDSMCDFMLRAPCSHWLEEREGGYGYGLWKSRPPSDETLGNYWQLWVIGEGRRVLTRAAEHKTCLSSLHEGHVGHFFRHLQEVMRLLESFIKPMNMLHWIQNFLGVRILWAYENGWNLMLTSTLWHMTRKVLNVVSGAM